MFGSCSGPWLPPCCRRGPYLAPTASQQGQGNIKSLARRQLAAVVVVVVVVLTTRVDDEELHHTSVDGSQTCIYTGTSRSPRLPVET